MAHNGVVNLLAQQGDTTGKFEACELAEGRAATAAVLRSISIRSVVLEKRSWLG